MVSPMYCTEPPNTALAFSSLSSKSLRILYLSILVQGTRKPPPSRVQPRAEEFRLQSRVQTVKPVHTSQRNAHRLPNSACSSDGRPGNYQRPPPANEHGKCRGSIPGDTILTIGTPSTLYEDQVGRKPGPGLGPADTVGLAVR